MKMRVRKKIAKVSIRVALFCFVSEVIRFVWVSIQFVKQFNSQFKKAAKKYEIHKRNRQQVVGGRRGEMVRLGGGRLEIDQRCYHEENNDA